MMDGRTEEIGQHIGFVAEKLIDPKHVQKKRSLRNYGI
jgi:hypothetical protein